MDNITKIQDIIDKYNHQLTVKELLYEFAYVIDNLYVDKFWSNIEKNKWIYIDNQILEWIGYTSNTKIYKPKQRYLELLNSFELNKDYKQLNSSELKEIYSTIDIPDDINNHNKTKHLLVSPRCFKETLMMLHTDKAKIIRKYYLDLEEIFNIYLQYQTVYIQSKLQAELKSKEDELNRVKDGSEHFKKIVINKNILKCKQYIYVATSYKYASKNIYKVGMTTSFKDRIVGYQTGRIEEDEFKYLYIMTCVSCKELEQYIFSRLEYFKYYDSKGKHKRELYEIHYNLLINILKEFENFELESTKNINQHLLDYYETYETLPLINLKKESISDIGQYIIEKCDSEFTYDPITPKDLTGSILTNEVINNELKEFGLQIISPYTGKCEDQQTYECLSIFKHKTIVTHSHMIETKSKGCKYCRKFGILDQIPIYSYTDKTYDFIKMYETFEILKEQEPNLNHQILRNIIREERWLTAHNNKVFSILSPINNKLDLNKELTEKEQIIIKTLDINYDEMKEKTINSKLEYILGIDDSQKIAYFGSSMTEMSSKLLNKKTQKLVNRKSISKHLGKNTEYAGYKWITTKAPIYENYTMINIMQL